MVLLINKTVDSKAGEIHHILLLSSFLSENANTSLTVQDFCTNSITFGKPFWKLKALETNR